MIDLAPIGFDENAHSVMAECPTHGRYKSILWKIPHPGGAKTEMWTGCPECVREHHQAKNGWMRPSRKITHRSSYKSTLIHPDGKIEIDYPELPDKSQHPRSAPKEFDQ